MKLTKLERRLLVNQYEIRKRLEEVDHYDEIITVLEEGYSSCYGDIARGLYDELPEQACEFVLEVLRMYTSLAHYYEDSGDEALKDEPFGEFSGFDGNNETQMLAFAKFLINVQRKFTALEKRAGETDGLNSHMPCSAIYARMLQVWDRKKFKVSAAEARAIVAAAKSPK